MSEHNEEKRKRPPDYEVEPMKLFDDCYYIGRHGVGVFAITTSEGIVLIDSMDPTEASSMYIKPGMIKLGLNPAEIKMIILTHGHFDHFSGAKRLQDEFDCKVGISKIDSGFMVESMVMGSIKDILYPHIDFIIEDKKTISVGNHKFLPVWTPGHTPGCMSLIFNVHDNGEEHMVSLWGGAGLPRKEHSSEIMAMKYSCDFAASAQKFYKICAQMNTHVVLGVHPHRMDLFLKWEQMKMRHQGDPNPYVVGIEGVRENLTTRAVEALDHARKFVNEM